MGGGGGVYIFIYQNEAGEILCLNSSTKICYKKTTTTTTNKQTKKQTKTKTKQQQQQKNNKQKQHQEQLMKNCLDVYKVKKITRTQNHGIS